MYVIMRKLGGYRHQDFFANDFMASEFFGLLDLVNDETNKENKQLKKADKKNGRK
jgi:hypothetical protein